MPNHRDELAKELDRPTTHRVARVLISENDKSFARNLIQWASDMSEVDPTRAPSEWLQWLKDRIMEEEAPADPVEGGG